MKTTLSPAAPMPVSSFFCDQFEAETKESRRETHIMAAVVAVLSAVSMWLTHLK